MFSLIYATMTAYLVGKGKQVNNLGSLIMVAVIADLIALYILFG